MNAQQLKNAILQEAIEGRLVPQDPNDEPASALLERIRKEKERLVKEGKLKKKDLEVKPIAEDEIPFEIPESWEWVRLGSVCDYIHRGKSPKYGEKKILPIMAQKCNQWDRIYTDRCLFAQEDTIERYTEEQFLRIGDVIVNSTGGGTVGRTGYVDDYVFKEYKRFVVDSHVTVVRGKKDVIGKYIYYFLISPLIQFGLEDRCSGSTNQIELGTTTICNYLFPLPPLAEQKRIVAKIEELLPKVEEYGKAQDALNKLNTELPERLKKSILQEAIEGRLVPQDPKDEPASVLLAKIRKEKEQLVKAGKLKKKDLIEIPITEDEIPFDIPESWEWVRINFLGEVITGGTPPKSELKYYGKDYPFFKPADLEQGINTISSTDSLSVEGYEHSRKLPKDSILVTCIGSIGKTGLIRKEGTCNQQINAIVPDKQIIVPEYLYYSCLSPFFQESMWDSSSSTTLAILNKNKFSQLLAPLPPLAEQKRIVAKLEQVLGEIDKLKK